jgi:hypothetical protein
MKNERNQSDYVRSADMSLSTALTWFAVALLLAMMLSSCTTQRGTALPCYYFADKGGYNGIY